MKVMVLGAGAVGAPLCTRLFGKCDLSLIMDDERKAKYDGIRVNGIHYDIPLAEENEKADLIIFACKNFDLAKAIVNADLHVKEGTIIVSLLNGVVSEIVLKQAFQKATVLYSFITSLSSIRHGSDVECFSENGGVIFIGCEDHDGDEALSRVTSLFDECSVTYKVPEDIRHEIWWKFMLNTAFNTLSAILQTSYRKMYDNASLLEVARMVIAEVRKVAQAEGIVLTEEDGERAVATVTALHDDGKTSMQQDVEAGRETENRWFTGTVSVLGKRHGLETPVSDLLFLLLEAKSHAEK
ncbi:MAG: ketopantoate reductase family protein [Bullifex sp.]